MHWFVEQSVIIALLGNYKVLSTGRRRLSWKSGRNYQVIIGCGVASGFIFVGEFASDLIFNDRGIMLAPVV